MQTHAYICCVTLIPVLNLDTLLLQIRSQVTPVWYEFGQAVGVSKELLDKCMGYPAEECVVEVIDHWLRSHKCTWRDVAEGLNAIGLEGLADDILKVYSTGNSSHDCMSRHIITLYQYNNIIIIEP